MNAYEATKKMYAISEELQLLSGRLGAISQVDERVRLEKKIDELEAEFFAMKHRLEKIQFTV